VPVLDWPVIGFIVAVHLLALSAFLPMTFSWPAVGVGLFLHWLTVGVGVTLVDRPERKSPNWDSSRADYVRIC